MNIKFHDKQSNELLTINSRCTAQCAESQIICVCLHNDDDRVLDFRIRNLDNLREVSIPVVWCPFCGKNYKERISELEYDFKEKKFEKENK